MKLDALLVDVYPQDLGGNPDIAKLVAAGPPWHGMILKATEGVSFDGGNWFRKYWPLARAAARDRYAHDWFRGCYSFLKFNVNGALQADYYLSTVESAGGWDIGDLWPIADCEFGSEKNSNQLASAQQIIDCVTAFAERINQLTGRRVALYGNGAMRDRDITTKMGCAYLWCPRYTATLPTSTYERAGWSPSELLLWQYCGDGVGHLAGYPTTSPIGRTDISVLTIPVQDQLGWLRSHLFAENPNG